MKLSFESLSIELEVVISHHSLVHGSLNDILSLDFLRIAFVLIGC